MSEPARWAASLRTRVSALWGKGRRKLRGTIVRAIRRSRYYPLIYPSYWRMRFGQRAARPTACGNYYTAVPHPGAGIGHQIANWIAGYWFARQFGLTFAHTAFASHKWERFLGFGRDEVAVTELTSSRLYRRVLLPLFDECNPAEVALTRDIITSYSGKNVVFVAEQDQGYRDQYGVIGDIRRKFHHAPARSSERLVYDPHMINVAVHVRRGDIAAGKEGKNSNLAMRWQDNDYFENVLKTLSRRLAGEVPFSVHLFSQGLRSDFQGFEKFPDVRFCLDMDAEQSFLHMVFADILITSKSSFSYKPALLNTGLKLCPAKFWHGYPDADDWILVGDDGDMDSKKLDLGVDALRRTLSTR